MAPAVQLFLGGCILSMDLKVELELNFLLLKDSFLHVLHRKVITLQFYKLLKNGVKCQRGAVSCLPMPDTCASESNPLVA